MNNRQSKLYDYFLDLTRDLLVRGTIRYHKTQSIEDAMVHSGVAVLKEGIKDFAFVAKKMGIGADRAMRYVGETLGDQLIDQGFHLLSQVFKTSKKK